MTERVYDKDNVILTRISEADLESFLVDFDIDDNGQPLYMLDKFTEIIIDTIPEYVFAHYENPNIPQTHSVGKLREAAKSIYKIKEYALMKRVYLHKDKTALSELKAQNSTNRGEFGELILHLLLRDFHGTIPLISKVYFKDSSGVPAHGFDSVHITPDEKILWLGESKFYTNSRQGVAALINDIKEHFVRDYLEEQVLVIKKNLENNEIPQRDEWIKTLNECSKLKDVLSIINIPLLCTYPHNIYNLYTDLSCHEAISCHEADIRELKAYFDNRNDHPLKSHLNIILMLFPVRNKKELVTKLHERLWHMQSM